MAWELFEDWTQLQFVYYSIAEEFEDGTIGAWRMEDWEIYGPGSGGYSSSGPYGNWEADIRVWLDNGSLLAEDIIDWDAAQLQSRNLSNHTHESAHFGSLTTFYLNGTSYLPYDPNPSFGASGSGVEYEEGEIVVVATRGHSDQSISYRFASRDPFTHEPVSWVENATFLDISRANADANVIRFEPVDGPPLTEQEEADAEVIREAVSDMITELRDLNPDGYFQVEGLGRITVKELISLLLRSDWEVHPAGTLDVPGSKHRIGDVERNGGNPKLRVHRDELANLALQPSLLYFYLVHETVHATRVGWEHGRVHNAQTTTNDITRAILTQVGKVVREETFGPTVITYHPNRPGT